MINTLYYLSLNKIRQYIHMIKRNKLYAFVYFLLILVSIPLFSEMFYTYELLALKWFPIILLIYSLAKVFQNNPILNVPFQYFEMKILSFKELKVYVFLKTIASSLVITLVWFMLGASFSPILMISLIANSLANYIGFIKYQLTTTELYLTLFISILMILLSVKLNASWLSLVLLLAMMIHLFFKKVFKYDYLYSYYLILSDLMKGLIDRDVTQISSTQNELLKDDKVSEHKLMEKWYDTAFFIAKEMTRAFFNIKSFLNICIYTLIIGFISYFYVESSVLHLGLFMLDLILIEGFLSKLNKTEFKTITTGFYLPIDLFTVIKQKWLAQSILVIIPLLTGLLIFSQVSYLALFIVVPFIPLRNIITNFTNSRLIKISMYVIGAVIFGVLYLI